MAEFIPTGIGGLTSRGPARRAPERLRGRDYARHELLPPPRPLRNYIPEPEAITALIERALAALAKGIYWDRGSILNLVL